MYYPGDPVADPVATNIKTALSGPPLNLYYGPDAKPESFGLPLHNTPWTNTFPIEKNTSTTHENSIWSSFNSSDPDNSVVQDVASLASPGTPSEIQWTKNKSYRRRHRAQQACSNCRGKKTRCGEERPSCQQCLYSHMKCEYQEKDQTKKEDSASMLKDISCRMESFEHIVKSVLWKETNATAEDLTGSPTRSTPTYKLVPDWNCIKNLYCVVGKPGFVPQRELSRDNLKLSAQFAVNKQSFHGIRRNPLRPFFSSTNTSENYVTIDSSTSGQIPDFEAIEKERARNLWITYLKRIHVLHPFLDVQRVGTIIEDIASTGVPKKLQPAFNSPFSGTMPGTREKIQEACRPVGTLKRKHSEEIFISDPSGFETYHRKTSTHARNTIDTATVLLVLALGEISTSNFSSKSLKEERTKGETTTLWPAPPSIRFSTLVKFGLTAYDCLECSSQNLDDYSFMTDSKRGVPGLSYYCCAVELLSSLLFSCEISFVHAKILAALYASQLDRPMEAWRSVYDAAVTMQFILDQYLNALDVNLQSPKMINSIRITSWTCLELESDIHAELGSLPRSGISRFKSHLPEPLGAIHLEESLPYIDLDMNKVMQAYFQQIELRKLLESFVCNDDKQISEYNIEQKVKTARILEAQLDFWKISLGNTENLIPLSWKDSEAPSSDIIIARMRANYYKAQVIIYRPFLQYILENEPLQSEVSRQGFSSQGSVYSVTSSNEDDAVYSKVLDFAGRCVEALVKSTEAFDALCAMPSRLVIPNVFVTAQAQFGNIMVLAATLGNKNHQWLIEREDFKRLLARTIKLFEGLPLLSSTMNTELYILTQMQNM